MKGMQGRKTNREKGNEKHNLISLRKSVLKCPLCSNSIDALLCNCLQGILPKLTSPELDLGVPGRLSFSNSGEWKVFFVLCQAGRKGLMNHRTGYFVRYRTVSTFL